MDYSDSKEAYLHRQRDMANLPPESNISLNAIRHAQEDMKNILPPSPPYKSTAPSTASILWAEWRRGLKDLQTAVLGAWGGTHEEPGAIASPTQIEVNHDRHPEPEQASYDTPAPAPDRPAGHDR